MPCLPVDTHGRQLSLELPGQGLLPKLDFVAEFGGGDIESFWSYVDALRPIYVSQQHQGRWQVRYIRRLSVT